MKNSLCIIKLSFKTEATEAEEIVETIPDHLKCPICMEIPANKVMQCKLGHILCEGCLIKIKKLNGTCPQCRIPFGFMCIRNLAVERSLDALQLECPYKTNGCTASIDRRSFKFHSTVCWYNFDK